MNKIIKCPFCNFLFDPITDFSEGIISGIQEVRCPGCKKKLRFDVVIEYSVKVILKTKKGGD